MILAPSTSKPAVATPQQVLCVIQSWEHWDRIGRVAQKEYGVFPDEFALLLPEYQKFIGLIVLGHRGVGMFSERIDRIWHAHILSTNLYEQFCMQVNGAFIHHLPNLDRRSTSECTKPDDICNNKCKGSCNTPRPGCSEEQTPSSMSFEHFSALYRLTYDMDLPAIWDSEADGVATA